MFQSNLYNKIHIPNYQRKKSKSPHYNKQIFQKYFQVEPSFNILNSLKENNYIQQDNLNALNDQIQFENIKLNFQILSQKIHRLNNIISNTDFTNSKRKTCNRNNSNYFNKSYNFQKNSFPFPQRNCFYNLNYNNNIYNNNFNNNLQYQSNNYQITKESENLSEIAENIIETFNLEKNNSEQDSNKDNSILISQEVLINDPCWSDKNSNINNNNNNQFQVQNYNKNFNNNKESNILEIQIKNNKIEEKVYTDNDMNYFNLMKKQLEYKIYRNMEYSYYATNDNNNKNTIKDEKIKQIKDYNRKYNNEINNQESDNIKKNKSEKLLNNKNKNFNFKIEKDKTEQDNLNKSRKKDKLQNNKEYEIKNSVFKENKNINQDEKIENILYKSNFLNSEEKEDLILSSIIENEIESNKKKKNVTFNDSSLVKISYNENDKVTQLNLYDNNNKLQFNPTNINFLSPNEKPKSIMQNGSNYNVFNSGSTSTLITPRDNNNSNIFSNNSNSNLNIHNLQIKKSKINDEKNDNVNRFKKIQINNSNIKNNKKDKFNNKNIIGSNLKNNSKEKNNKTEGIIILKDISQKLKTETLNKSKEKKTINTNNNKNINLNKSNSKVKK